MLNNNFGDELFISNLQKTLVKICTDHNLLNKQLYDIEELMEKWHESAPQYMADVVPEFARYPMVSIAWACYYGIGAAVYWDACWDNVKDIPDLYVKIRDKRGFDYMDDYVLENMMGLNQESPKEKEAKEAKKWISTIQECAEYALNAVTHQGIEPGTKHAYIIFAKVARQFFLLGVSLALYSMGYKYEKSFLK